MRLQVYAVVMQNVEQCVSAKGYTSNKGQELES